MIKWLDERLHVSDLMSSLFAHPVPKRSNLLDYLGLATLFVFINQAVTGILLATKYVPSAAGAWASVKNLDSTTIGHYVRSLHSWGANFMVVIIALHLLRVFYEGAYKKPRELTWVAGGVLLLATLGLAFTGYLLPWDQTGYWATTVGTAMASYVPGVGDFILQVMRDGTSVTGATLTRFYSIHMLVLPAIILLAFGLHFFFVLRQGMAVTDELADAKARGENVEKSSIPFWPNVAWRMVITVLLVAAALWVLAGVYPKGLGSPADPLNKQHFIPTPAWYFFGVYQLLKYFPGKLDGVAMVAMPLVFVVVLFGLPWLDRNPSRLKRKRPVALGVAAVLVIGLVFLTYQGIESVPKPLPNGVVEHPSFTKNIEPIFQSKCSACHGSGSFYALDNYSDVMKANVIPGNPDGSKIIKKLEGTDQPQMPLGQTPLSKDQIQTIKNWIQDGAKNN